ncbi:dipeptidyl peptidase III [Penicillium malachiteum]|uniref:Dipeptidyl peptidase III n=1 Tax=Penicillium malachiteum TaxID=1324776 RepID=A0AAD6HNM0_9EURO|nr:dipeptidyl peptidase III [Penicillium malachiteum]
MATPKLSSQRAATHQLAIKKLFDDLTQSEKLYAHHLSRAAWYDSRIILRQTSPEGTGIFDFFMELHRACGGEWNKLVDNCDVSPDELDNFLEFSGLFLSNLGNYFGDGDRKVVPDLSADALRKMASISPGPCAALEKIIGPLLETPPFSLGFPGRNTQSNYYPGEERITKEDIAAVARVMEKNEIEPENTRLQKITREGNTIYKIF